LSYADDDLRNIIERLAVFVARNGKEFEDMTKEKQRGNPRFAFLYGGEFYNYYMYRVTTEQAILKHRGQQSSSSTPFSFPPQQNNAGGMPPNNNMMMGQRFPPPQLQQQSRFECQNQNPSPSGGFSRFDQRPPGRFDQRPNNFPQNPNPPSEMNFGGNFIRPPPQHGNFEPRLPTPADFDNRNPPKLLSTPQNPPNNNASPPVVDIEALKCQKAAFEEQMSQSEQNLTAQQTALMSQQQKQIEESIRIVQDAEIKQSSSELGVDLGELDTVLAPIIDNCTKDAISAGKAWIFTHTPTPAHYKLLTVYLLKM